jgi:hypothetical protein
MTVLSDFNDKAHTDWASDDPEVLYKAAEMGQIGTLIVDPSRHQWFKLVNGEVKQVGENSANAEDLFNAIAVKTLASGGRVVAIDLSNDDSKEADKRNLPTSGIAAIFRSPVEAYVE